MTQKSTFPTVCRQHLHTSMSRISSSRFLLRGVQRHNQTRVPQFPSSAHDLCEELDPSSARSEHTPLIPSMEFLYYFTSWPNFFCHVCLRRHNIPGVCNGCELVLRLPWAQQFSSGGCAGPAQPWSCASPG